VWQGALKIHPLFGARQKTRCTVVRQIHNSPNASLARSAQYFIPIFWYISRALENIRNGWAVSAAVAPDNILTFCVAAKFLKASTNLVFPMPGSPEMSAPQR